MSVTLTSKCLVTLTYFHVQTISQLCLRERQGFEESKEAIRVTEVEHNPSSKITVNMHHYENRNKSIFRI